MDRLIPSSILSSGLAARVLRADVCVLGVFFHNLGASCDPADTRAGRYYFREGVEAHDAAVDVHGEITGDERIEEFVVGGRRRDDGGVGAGVGLHLEEVVWLVLDDVDVVLLAYGVKSPSTLGALRSTGWILAALMSTPDSFVSASEKWPTWGTLIDSSSNGKYSLDGRPPPSDMRPGVARNFAASFRETSVGSLLYLTRQQYPIAIEQRVGPYSASIQSVVLLRNR
ncbi:hypothetical protein HBI69_073510 [Parastagonospora nodorum]|nr:hypothetical protein HBI69_073510 [Parastagonospora nodorum]